MDVNTDQFFSMALTTARRNLLYAQDARQAAREALQEAHSSLSQAAFFAALDALGGEQAALAQLMEALRQDD